MAEPTLATDQLGVFRSELAPKQMAHLVVRTARFHEAIRFYRTMFGAEIAFANRRFCFLTYDHEHHRIAIIRMPRPLRLLSHFNRIGRKFYGIDHVAYTFENLHQLMRVYERMKAAGYQTLWATNHGTTTVLYYEDPDGNRLELQVDNFDTAEELQQWFASGEFEKNNLGVNFDPDLMLQQLRAGVPEKELKRQGAAWPSGKRRIAGMRAINWRTL
ncbi:MAG: biphenyl 2,3-dioxygenase [Candidatus Dadabacteria bacterium]|nr:MAG: biphenyl 2,3-dioxygenase [Candidatus Dadabacteria bacterium]